MTMVGVTQERTSNRWFKPSASRGKTLFVAAGLVPILTYFFVFHIYPIFFALYISLQRWPLLRPQDRGFVGLRNYEWALNAPAFWVSYKNTVYYGIAKVSLSLLIGLVLALSLNTLGHRLRTTLRAVFFLPVMTSGVVTALVFQLLYTPGKQGLLNYLLSFVGLGPFLWANSPTQVMPALIIMGTWKSTGYYMVIFLAGLTTIPREYYEAGAIDGASRWQRFRYITLPLLRPTTMFAVVTATISAFQVFTQVYVLSHGGPGTASRVLAFHLWQTAFSGSFEMGRGAAIAILILASILILALMQMRYLREGFEY